MPALQRIERVRAAARAVVPRSLYLKLAALTNALLCVRRLGWRQSRRLRNLQVGLVRNRNPVAFTAKNLDHPILLRPGASDAAEFVDTVVREAYGQHAVEPPIRFIIDAGANIGDASAWYLSRFGEARVAAIEPDPENLGMARRNLAPYGDRAVLWGAALWPETVKLCITAGSLESAYSVRRAEENAPFDCEGVTPMTILRSASRESIDIFKCDIEGAEFELFSSPDCDEWLAVTRNLWVEVHGPEAERAVLEATARFPFQHDRYRNHHIFRRPAAGGPAGSRSR